MSELDLIAAFELGVEGRTNLAETTGMDVNQVTNAMKRLKTFRKRLPEALRHEIAERIGGDS